MAIGPGQQGFAFNELSINISAPEASGVYALYRQDAWVYIGESKNIRNRLLEHLRIQGTCIAQNRPTGFQFELVQEWARVARQDELIAALSPICNQRFG